MLVAVGGEVVCGYEKLAVTVADVEVDTCRFLRSCGLRSLRS